MAVSFSSMPQASSFFAAYASISAFVMIVQTILNQLVPRQLRQYLFQTLRRYFRPRQGHATVVVEERDGMSNNEVYAAVETYLCTRIRSDVDRLRISKRFSDPALTVRFAQCEKIPDRFDDIDLEWRFVSVERKKSSKVIDEDTNSVDGEAEKRFFELCFDKKHKERVLDLYVPFVMERAKSIRDEKKVVKLHTLACASSYGSSIVWDSVNLEHPSTFETLAMEPALKNSITDDLDRFVRRKDFYRKVGRAWKRGYLLYGPPGTGKSSLIAAIANYLKFDIYDLELTNVRRDSDLRRLLLRTANRSILVIEDIDCTVELPDRKGKGKVAAGLSDGQGRCIRPRDQSEQKLERSKFTLSGLLNFIDGLWSSCGDERIIIFTTNNKDKLDPALLRPGRMDMHIHMSYITPEGFRLLAATYLNIQKGHPGLLEIEDLIKDMNVTPAEVAEELMKSDDADVSLRGLLDILKCMMQKKLDRENAKNDKPAEEEDKCAEDGDEKAEDDVGNESDGEVVCTLRKW